MFVPLDIARLETYYDHQITPPLELYLHCKDQYPEYFRPYSLLEKVCAFVRDIQARWVIQKNVYDILKENERKD